MLRKSVLVLAVAGGASAFMAPLLPLRVSPTRYICARAWVRGRDRASVRVRVRVFVRMNVRMHVFCVLVSVAQTGKAMCTF